MIVVSWWFDGGTIGPSELPHFPMRLRFSRPDRLAMKEYITHFMWGYQGHFRGSVETGSERILETLKPGLNPRVFIVGVRIDDDADKFPACVEPEANHWAPSSELYDVLDDVPDVQQEYPESQLIHSLPIAQARADEQLFRRAVRDAVKRRLQASKGFPEDVRLFASWPIERDGFLVITLMTVTGSVLDEVPSVASASVKLTTIRTLPVPRSLVEAVIDQILATASDQVIKTDAGAGLFVLGSGDQLVQRAASRFFSGLLFRVDQDSMMMGVAEEVFDRLTRLALAPYERAEAKGRLIFAQRGASVGSPVLTLAKPQPLGRARALRKLLALTDDEFALQCNCDSAFAIVHAPASETAHESTSVSVKIIGRGKWTAAFGGRELMVMSDGHPSLPKPVVEERVLAQNLRRVFRSMSEADATGYARIGTALASSGHGALIVIAEDAPQEADRLQNQSLPVAPTPLNPELAVRLSGIDGALLCDPQGICHAIGVILDGRASAIGDPGRGSRFNSALRFVASSSHSTAAMVVSEDGGLDLLPSLKPVLSGRELNLRLAKLESLAAHPSNPPDREREIKVIDWIRNHEFYLNEEQCQEANGWIAECEERFFAESSMRVTRRPLRPDPEFDPSRDLV